jgi:hypothetical protein
VRAPAREVEPKLVLAVLIGAGASILALAGLAAWHYYALRLSGLEGL